jgi:uncharacterized membrane protein
MSNQNIKGQSAAMVSYLTIVGALIAMSMNSQEKNSFASFHIRQAFGVHLLYIITVLTLKDLLDGLSYGVILLIYLFLWGHGFWNAIQGKMKLTPFIGTYFQKWFSFIN